MGSSYSQKRGGEQPLFSARRVPGETTRYHLRVARSQISFLRFIFEAYDGIAVVRTADARQGRIVLHVAPGCEEVVETVLADLSGDLLMEPVLTDGESALQEYQVAGKVGPFSTDR